MNDTEQMDFLYELFDASLPRLGPGGESSTKKALDMLLSARAEQKDKSVPKKLRILDIGCGNGAQTIELAKNIDGTIMAVDNHQPYLNELQRRAKAEGVSKRIQPSLKDMRDLGLPECSFDLIWSEAALYNMGFREGLARCRLLLVPGGFLGVSELCWLRPDPPVECQVYFANEYPAMKDIDTNLSIIQSTGYKVVGHFTLPESDWWESYYHPLEDRLQSLRKKYVTDTERLAMIDSVCLEIDICRKYLGYYGYIFFMMQCSR